MSGVLARILHAKREEIAMLKRRPAGPPLPAPSAYEALFRPPGAPLRLIAEIKHRSPTAGPLSTALSTGARARAYANGAAMISVLCDAPFFDGGWDQVVEARAAVNTPILAKEFVLDPRQIEEAAASGASAVLIIVRILDTKILKALISVARELGREPLVEVVDEGELAVAVDAGARVVGVNARDLDTLVMDGERAARVVSKVPAHVVALHLSGIKTPDDVAALARGPAHGALLGEALMREHEPSALLARLVARTDGS